MVLARGDRRGQGERSSSGRVRIGLGLGLACAVVAQLSCGPKPVAPVTQAPAGVDEAETPTEPSMAERMQSIGQQLQRSDVDIDLSQLTIEEVDTKGMASRLLIEKVADDSGPGKRGVEVLTHLLLGTTPGEASPQAVALAGVWSLAGHLAGLYLPKGGEILINPSFHSDPSGVDQTIAHELGHAHHAQLAAAKAPLHDASGIRIPDIETLPETTDGRLAWSMLREGYAEVVGLQWIRGQRGGSMQDVDPLMLSCDPMSDVQAPIHAEHYLLGSTFALGQLQAGGWPQLQGRVLQVPVSSEQVIHADKWARDLPTEFPADRRLLRAGYKLAESDRVGELGVRILLRVAGLDRPTARRVSTGWDGDALRVYIKGDDVLVLWRTVWDRRVDAEQFHEALRQLPTMAEGVHLRRRKHLVDFAWISNPRRRKAISRQVARLASVRAPRAEDRASSARAEQAVQAALRGRPRLEGQQLVIDALGVEIGFGDWQAHLESMPIWLSPAGNPDHGLITVQWLANADAVPLDEVTDDLVEGLSDDGQWRLSQRTRRSFAGMSAWQLEWNDSEDSGSGATRSRQRDILFAYGARIGWLSLRRQQGDWAVLQTAFETMMTGAKAMGAPSETVLEPAF